MLKPTFHAIVVATITSSAQCAQAAALDKAPISVVVKTTPTAPIYTSPVSRSPAGTAGDPIVVTISPDSKDTLIPSLPVPVSSGAEPFHVEIDKSWFELLLDISLAFFTAILAVATVRLVLATWTLAEEGRLQREILLDAVNGFRKTQVFDLLARLPFFYYECATVINPSRPAFNFWFGNHHVADAFIRGAKIAFWKGDPPKELTWRNLEPHQRIVKQGNYVHLEIALDNLDISELGMDAHRQVSDSQIEKESPLTSSTIYAAGEISYTDFTGVASTYGFCLKCTRLFRPADAKDKERAPDLVSQGFVGTDWTQVVLEPYSFQMKPNWLLSSLPLPFKPAPEVGRFWKWIDEHVLRMAVPSKD